MGESELGNNHKTGFSLFQPTDGLVVVKAFVCADYDVTGACWNLGEAGSQKLENAAGSMNISGTQLAMPEVLGLPLETQQGVVASSPALDRVVTNARLFLFPVDHQHRRVQVEDQPRWLPRREGHLHQESIVELSQFRQGWWRHPQQEASLGGRVGISRQPTQVLKDAIGLQQICGLDPFQAQDHRIKDGKQQLADAVAIVSLGQPDMRGDCILETDSS